MPSLVAKCITCNKRKRRNKIGNRFVSDNGKAWRSSTMCGDCSPKINRDLQKRQSEWEVPIYWENKNCATCSSPLLKTNYKYCNDCKEIDDSDDIDTTSYLRFDERNFKISELPLLAGEGTRGRYDT